MPAIDLINGSGPAGVRHGWMPTRERTHSFQSFRVRYSLNEAFLEQVRPMLVTIFGEEIAPERRIELLELVAESCARQAGSREGRGRHPSALRSIGRDLDKLAG